MRLVSKIDRWLSGRSSPGLVVVTVVVAALIGCIDYLTGYELSLGLFYIAPVSAAAWYVGRSAGVGVAVASCIVWFLADTGHDYSHPAFQGWNALIRLGFFLVSSLLVSALRASLSKQQALARTDGLTGLLTRRAFEARFEHDLALAERSLQPVVLAYIDLDDFKRVNDEQGHAVGDRVLRIAADVMRSRVRRADTVARLGGDEFAVLLPNTSSGAGREVIASVAGELRAALRSSGFGVDCSVGVITLEDFPVSAEAALAAADALMYEVKKKGKGSVEYAVLGEDFREEAREGDGEAGRAGRGAGNQSPRQQPGEADLAPGRTSTE